MVKIYLATSWSNPEHAKVLTYLRRQGHEVYDFKNPTLEQAGFKWERIDNQWQSWKAKDFAYVVPNHPVAKQYFNLDRQALDNTEALVLLMPCGRSAHLEAGYAAGQGKKVVIYFPAEIYDEHYPHKSPQYKLDNSFQPELMYLFGTVVTYEAALAWALDPSIGDEDFLK
jgi:hypothetical protein